MPIKNLNDFYITVKTAGVRLTHQFQMQIFGGGVPAVGLENLTIWAEGSQLPSVTQNTAEMAYGAYPFNVPTNFNMSQDLSLNIRSDANMELRQGMLNWVNYHSKLDITVAGAGGGSKTIPDAMVQLDLLDEFMTGVIQTYTLHGVIPTEVGTIDLSNTDAGIATFAFNLKYQFFTISGINFGPFTGR